MANPNTLSFLRYQDVQIPDVTLQTAFNTAIKQGNYTQALRILAQNDSLTGKAYTATVINKIITGVTYLEDLYHDNVILYMSDLSEGFEELTKRFHDLTEWDSTVEYNTLTFVSYNNRVYMALQENIPIGTLPTDTAFWLYLGLEGEAGKPGIDGEYRAEWYNGTAYNANDVVTYNNKVYIAIKASTGVVPTDTSSWALFWDLISGKVYVGKSEPDEIYNDAIWLKTEYDIADIPVGTVSMLGTFRRFDGFTNDWQDMYPNILFDSIVGHEKYYIAGADYNISILKDVSTQTFTDAKLKESSFVRVFPTTTMTSAQYSDYNKLTTIEVSNGSFTLNASSNLTTGCTASILIIY